MAYSQMRIALMVCTDKGHFQNFINRHLLRVNRREILLIYYDLSEVAGKVQAREVAFRFDGFSVAVNRMHNNFRGL